MTDEIDNKILNELMQNSRKSFRDIAHELGVSTVTVMKHVKKLEKEKIIKGYSTDVDYEKLGYDIDVIINVKIAKGRFDEMYERLKNNPCILALYNITGDFDAAVLAKFKNRNSFNVFLKKLQTVPDVERTNTVFILKIFEKNGLKLS